MIKFDKKDHDYYRCLNEELCEFCIYKPNNVHICDQPIYALNNECLHLSTKQIIYEVLIQYN